MQTKQPRHPAAGLQGAALDPFQDWNRLGPLILGPSGTHTWRTDPRRLPITLSRYKHVAKLLAGKKHALEVGCGDGLNMRLVLQTVPSIHGVDVSDIYIDWARQHAEHEGLNCTFEQTDVTTRPISGTFDAAYSLDVIEHIPFESEATFLRNLAAPLTEDATCIIGTPNIHAEKHASKWSSEGHINLKSAETLRAALEPIFSNVFIFSMNDEVLHTGFYPMAHYLLAVCAGLRRSAL